MPTINSTDIIFATVTRHGDTIFDSRLVGFSSMKQLMAYLRRCLSGTLGLLTLNLRNGSQGWSSRTAFRFAMAEGTQLSLF